MRLAILAACLFTASSSVCVAADSTRQPGTVHLCRTGMRGEHYQITVDTRKAFKIGNDACATFQLLPGQHEITARVAQQERSLEMDVAPGADYFVSLDAEVSGLKRSVFSAGLAGNAQFVVNLVRVDAAPIEHPKTEKLDDSVLAALKASTFPVPSTSASEQLPISSLTDEQVKSAILQGSYDRDLSQIGLVLNDAQTNLGSHILTPQYAVSGFTVMLFTPERWIEYQAALAKHELRPFGVADVTPDMRLDTLHVVALPSAPDRLDGADMSAASGVDRVVVCSAKCAQTIQPLSQEAGTVTLDSALRSMDYTKLASTFNAAEVDTLRNAKGVKSFYVAVIGENGSRKLFEVQNRLMPGL
jgi:hypothetical protein